MLQNAFVTSFFFTVITMHFCDVTSFRGQIARCPGATVDRQLSKVLNNFGTGLSHLCNLLIH